MQCQRGKVLVFLALFNHPYAEKQICRDCRFHLICYQNVATRINFEEGQFLHIIM